MIAVTVSHAQRISVETEVRSVRAASQRTVSSKSRVCRAVGRAHGTCSVRTPQCGQWMRRIS
ncbi:hypothetical protein Rwratislav_38351 [Rhodococcus wratislaviensis IFP 2016]|nr:hypothetical protein Rwratislav_38351 [Rhodococcus wratislaviensis IFP 2016]